MEEKAKLVRCPNCCHKFRARLTLMTELIDSRLTDDEIKHLEWIYERLWYVYKENLAYDYMLKMKEIIAKLREK